MTKTKEYFFVIDTDSYAGNFHRELTDSMTGLKWDEPYGESPVFKDLIMWKDIEEDDYLIAAYLIAAYQEIRATPESGNTDSVALFLSRKPALPEVNELMRRAIETAQKKSFSVLRFRLLLVETTVTENCIDRWEVGG